jgi:hypothetical protein
MANKIRHLNIGGQILHRPTSSQQPTKEIRTDRKQKSRCYAYFSLLRIDAVFTSWATKTVAIFADDDRRARIALAEEFVRVLDKQLRLLVDEKRPQIAQKQRDVGGRLGAGLKRQTIR